MYKHANNYDRETLEQRLANEAFKRTPISFYRYVHLDNLEEFRNELYQQWGDFGVLGRIYIAKEGINAQINIPEDKIKEFRALIDSRKEFADVPFKVGLQDTMSFIKLTIKIKKQIVADGLTIDDYDITNVGTHLEPEDFHSAMEDPETIVVDMRNHYESRIGKFEGAITPDVDTFREQLPMVRDDLKGSEEKKILLYCTGGIRCEKTSAYLRHYGFKDVNQLHGGIIAYGHAVKKGTIHESKFKGKNFVFDERLAERLTDDILSVCDLCETKSDRQLNCSNETCHILFIQCEDCGEKLNNCCTQECKTFFELPIEERRRLRKGNSHPTSKAKYGEQLRPRFRHL
jgi:UPF0176 protein